MLVGGWATATGDRRVTPVSTDTPGVFVHAALANSILTGRFLRSAESRWETSGLILTLVALVVAFSTLRARWGLLVAIGLFLAVLAATFGLFNAEGILWRVAPLLGGIALCAILLAAVHIPRALVRGMRRKHSSASGELASAFAVTELADPSPSAADPEPEARRQP